MARADDWLPRLRPVGVGWGADVPNQLVPSSLPPFLPMFSTKGPPASWVNLGVLTNLPPTEDVHPINDVPWVV